MKLYIRGSRGGRNGLYSSELALRERHVGLELALHERHVGLTEMTICRYSLFLSPKFVLYWAAKACKRFTIPDEDHFYVHRS